MARIIRTTSTLHVAPPAPATEDELPDEDGRELPGESPNDLGARATTPPPSPPPAAVPAQEPQRRRGRQPAAPAAVVAPAPAPPAGMPSAQALQGLGLLYVIARGSGLDVDDVVNLLRAAIAAHDALRE